MTPRPLAPRARRIVAYGLVMLLSTFGLVPGAFAQSGSIQPAAIEIDKNANLYPGDGNANILNPGATVDWVKDALANTDTDPDPNDPIAYGIVPGVTGAVGGKGHWNGLRIVDGVAQGDQDIFLTGGKENDTSTWNVGPGSVGSSKYDITQAYIANNQSTIFFGMERRGNNGTTAFDFEFNQVGTVGGYVPTRTVNDVLLTFEMQGSGGSGSAVPHVYRWNGSSYAEVSLNSLPAGLVTSINNVEVKPAPWGYVDSKGEWVLSPDIPRFEFAEAAVPLSVLPGVNSCGGFAYVQVRTRSSSTATSDLKDTTKIFRYEFGGPSATAVVTPSCTTAFSYSAAGSSDSSGNTTTPNLTYSWTFQKLVSGSWTNVGTSSSASGTFDPGSDGHYRALLTVTEVAGCTASTNSNEIDVVRMFATASKQTANGSALTVTLSGNAPSGSSFQWQRFDGTNWVNISGASASSLVYSSFESDASATPTSFSISPNNYVGKMWTVMLRVQAQRGTCPATSNAVTVKKVTAVDP